jgi:phosphinothricin acetyltransferase
MEQYSVRKATPSDFLEISALDRTAWGTNRNSDFIPDGEHVWRLWVEYAYTYIAIDEDSGKIIGVNMAMPTNVDHMYFLHKIILDPAHRQKGAGSMLFDIMFAEMDAIGGTICLTTDTNNVGMHKLCEKYGFSEKDSIKGYYRPEEDRLILERKPKNTKGLKSRLSLS